jgi:STE24 endopeptidase
MADKTRKANAALAGLGATRRILISDTLLAEHSDDEIEVVLAHELAHHVHRDLWSSLAMEGLLLAAGFYAADRVLDRATGVFGLTGKTDIAALPLLVLSAAAVMVLLRPFANALSRRHERRADRYALDATGNTAAFISAMKRLGAQNLAEEQPPRLVELLFYTHPPMAARIAAAQTLERSERSERS